MAFTRSYIYIYIYIYIFVHGIYIEQGQVFRTRSYIISVKYRPSDKLASTIFAGVSKGTLMCPSTCFNRRLYGLQSS
jgi:hypothetical protein